MAPRKSISKVDAERARLFKLTTFNPIRGLTPAKLSTALDAFDRGELRAAVLMWQKIMERDDQVKTCHPKRTRNVTGLDWEILPVDDSGGAAQHKEKLEHFYNNLTAFDGLNENERGGMRILLRHMMTAVGLRYACHEIIWQPDTDGGLTAEFKFLPLQFFENTTGRLQFLPTDQAVQGKPLDEVFGPQGWMVTSGEGIMLASSIAYIFKNLPLKSWLTYCEKYGVPGLHGKTSATKGSAEWNALRDALNGFGEDLALVTNEGASITPIASPNSGTQPHPPLVDRMDRAISRLWLGGDLATMSAGEGSVGSQPQSDDLQKLQEDDAAMITDALQVQVDRRVIGMLFGEGTSPLAYFKLKPPARINIDREIKIDEFLIRATKLIGQKDLLERYGRAEPDEGDAIALAAAPAGAPGFGLSNGFNTRRLRASNEQPFRAAALKDLSAAQVASLQPIITRVEVIMALTDDELPAALNKLKTDLPELQKQILADPQVAAAFEKIFSAALVSGAAESRAKLGQTITPPTS